MVGTQSSGLSLKQEAEIFMFGLRMGVIDPTEVPNRLVDALRHIYKVDYDEWSRIK